MALAELRSLRSSISEEGPDRFIWNRVARARVNDLARGTSLGGRFAELTGRSVLIATGNQLTTALALIELDGRARRLVILPPDIVPDHLGGVISGADVDGVVIDHGSAKFDAFKIAASVECSSNIVPIEQRQHAFFPTEWVLLTSGTTGAPKMVAHSLAGLTAAIAPRQGGDPVVWGTFYDIRRYGGLQILLRAILGGASLVLSNPGEPVADHLARLAQHGVTHLTGTPSHWRRALMSAALGKISPRYVRLSGEVADQTILDSLHATFPQAGIGHAYASTEAGVAFEVNDGQAGFPAALVEAEHDGVAMKVIDDSLYIRSPRGASHYIGEEVAALTDQNGFIDTGDIVEKRGDRYFFAGRRGGVINIGGLKVHPEEIEAVINRHPQVRMSLVRSRRSPITGSIVIADVVLKRECERASEEHQVRNDILALCRGTLPRHKVPAAISFVPMLVVAPSGKLARRYG
jgi:acyl-coenzyme A synthetase/AMP-(fatty) acid ligase